MGCNNTKDIQNTVGQKQLLVQISDKLKNYKQEFKSYSEFHRIDEKTKSVMLTKCSTFHSTNKLVKNKTIEIPYKELGIESQKCILEKKEKKSESIYLVAKFPSKKVQEENDVLFVDGKLIFLTEPPKMELEEDNHNLLKILKQNNISVAEYLSGNREQILEEIREKDERALNERKMKIVSQYFSDEILNTSFLNQ